MMEADEHAAFGDSVLLAPYDLGPSADENRSYPVIPDFSAVPDPPSHRMPGMVVTPTPTKSMMGPPRSVSPRTGKRRSVLSPLKIDFSDTFASPPHSRHPALSLSSNEVLDSLIHQEGRTSPSNTENDAMFSPSQLLDSKLQSSPGRYQLRSSPRTPMQFKAALARLERGQGRRLGLCS